MFKLFEKIARLVHTLISLALVAALGVGGWFAWQIFDADKAALQKAQAKLADAQTKIQKLEIAIRLLKVDRRVAQIEVLSQTGSAAEGNLATRFSFVEHDSHGRPLGQPKVFQIKGDQVYIDAWLIKFNDEFIEGGNDPLRSASLYLFRRIFGESQQPNEGFPLDAPGESPAPYRAHGEMSDSSANSGQLLGVRQRSEAGREIRRPRRPRRCPLDQAPARHARQGDAPRLRRPVDHSRGRRKRNAGSQGVLRKTQDQGVS